MTTPRPVYGLIEWDGTWQPTIIVGCCVGAILSDIVAIFTAITATGGAIGSPEFRQHHPLPDPQRPTVVLADWLAALHEDTADPYVTLLDPAELVHTGHNLLVSDRYAANPYYTRDIAPRPAAGPAPRPGCGPPPRLPTVDPEVYLRADDDGDWLTCPSCHGPITMLTGGDTLGALLAEAAAHRCARPGPAMTP